MKVYEVVETTALGNFHKSLCYPSRMSALQGQMSKGWTASFSQCEAALGKAIADPRKLVSFFDREGGAHQLEQLKQTSDELVKAGAEVDLLYPVALRLNDEQLKLQLRVVDALAKVVPAAVAFATTFSVVRAQQDVDAAALQQKFVKEIKALSTQSQLLSALMSARSGELRWDTCFGNVSSGNTKHLPQLDEVLFPQFLLVNLADEIQMLLSLAKGWCAEHIERGCTVVECCCTDWEPYAINLMQQPTIIDNLLSNKNYVNINTVAADLETWYVFGKAMKKQANVVFTDDLLGRARRCIELAPETVCLTWALNIVTKVLPPIQNLPVRVEKSEQCSTHSRRRISRSPLALSLSLIN